MKPTDPFRETEIEYKVLKSGVKGGDPWAMLSPYVKPYAILDRLDECFPNWSDSSYKDENGIWTATITTKFHKDSGIEMSRIGISQFNQYEAFYRAAVKFGIGRYLYKLDYPLWASFMYVDNRQGGCGEMEIEGERYYYLPPKLPMWALHPEDQERRRKLSRKGEGKWQKSKNQQVAHGSEKTNPAKPT